ncbi:peroxide stress protein YaaA [Lentibacter sp. XHP0401]|jgi:uncharacterized protein|uniref:peroxide stress protein YaaA n=1 Tax=Lentibacter sp. XHP0401 TaxID=2984334 RepID=UPI0021E8B099|nr:peroxide stress protein YaaA [Lentibacter sp. XHP0401]MCV2893538.1 peroxide stress protein YaaA [Lentibacter sp. XHP0401]
MLVVISPAKKLNEESSTELPVSEPVFAQRAEELAKEAAKLTAGDLAKLMHLSDSLAKLNYDRFQNWAEMKPTPAALMFNGDTYSGLEASSLEEEEMLWATDHLRILSGLYGLLRPLDAIKPYRLEMGSRIKTPKGKNLYEFWGSAIAEQINSEAAETGAEILVNCASQEYFGAVDTKALKLRVVTPMFYEDKPQGPKIVSFYAKKARGAMARYIIQHRLEDADSLKEFDTGGYAYAPDLSEPDKPAFLRAG